MRTLVMIFVAFVATVLAQRGEATELVAPVEACGFERTTTAEEAYKFLEALAGLPLGGRLSEETFGRSGLGRRLRLFRVSSGSPLPLRVLIIGNIHGGEVDGKEALLLLLREWLSGQHQEHLKHLELVVVPIFNIDGNEEISRNHRVNQNGPESGVGRRSNAQDLDLNRDFVKLESPEVRALVALAERFDPHLFMDLHTTNGSHHGYHLTYAPALSLNQDDALSAFTRETFLPQVRKAAEAIHGVRTSDYGNFTSGKQPVWRTFSADTRLGWNYMGLRGRLSILSESYSYLDLKGRTMASRAFVVETLNALVEHRETVRQLCDDADRRGTLGAAGLQRFRSEPRFEAAREVEFLMGTVTDVTLPDGRGVRHVASETYEAKAIPVSVRFVADREEAMPAGWAIPHPSEKLRVLLRRHGITAGLLSPDWETQGDQLVTAGVSLSPVVFQGHRLVRMRGELESTQRTLPRGTLIVPAHQAKALLAASLLDPRSDDSFLTWNVFDKELEAAAAALPKSEGRFVVPVLRLLSLDEASLVLDPIDVVDTGCPGLLPLHMGTDAPTATLVLSVRKEGESRASRDYEVGATWEGRELSVALGAKSFDDFPGVIDALKGFDPGGLMVIEPRKLVVSADVDRLARALATAGFKHLVLKPYEE